MASRVSKQARMLEYCLDHRCASATSPRHVASIATPMHSLPSQHFLAVAMSGLGRWVAALAWNGPELPVTMMLWSLDRHRLVETVTLAPVKEASSSTLEIRFSPLCTWKRPWSVCLCTGEWLCLVLAGVDPVFCWVTARRTLPWPLIVSNMFQTLAMCDKTCLLMNSQHYTCADESGPPGSNSHTVSVVGDGTYCLLHLLDETGECKPINSTLTRQRSVLYAAHAWISLDGKPVLVRLGSNEYQASILFLCNLLRGDDQRTWQAGIPTFLPL